MTFFATASGLMIESVRSSAMFFSPEIKVLAKLRILSLEASAPSASSAAEATAAATPTAPTAPVSTTAAAAAALAMEGVGADVAHRRLERIRLLGSPALLGGRRAAARAEAAPAAAEAAAADRRARVLHEALVERLLERVRDPRVVDDLLFA